MLVRPYDDHASRPSVDTAHLEDVLPALEVHAENLLVVAQPVAPHLRTQQRGHGSEVELMQVLLEHGARVDHGIHVFAWRGVTAQRGNVFLEALMGTDVRFIDTDDYEVIYAEMDRIGSLIGKPYYKIPCGGSNALGTLGYVACAEEIAGQGLHFDHIVCAEGSGGTMAGLALGAKRFLPGTRVHGMMVDREPFDQITPRLMREAAALLEAGAEIGDTDFTLTDVCGPGYAIPSEAGNAAVRLMAAAEGLFLDPVYTGKAFGGLIQMARDGAFGPDENVLFLHSGGAGGLFAVE